MGTEAVSAPPSLPAWAWSYCSAGVLALPTACLALSPSAGPYSGCKGVCALFKHGAGTHSVASAQLCFPAGAYSWASGTLTSLDMHQYFIPALPASSLLPASPWLLGLDLDLAHSRAGRCGSGPEVRVRRAGPRLVRLSVVGWGRLCQLHGCGQSGCSLPSYPGPGWLLALAFYLLPNLHLPPAFRLLRALP